MRVESITGVMKAEFGDMEDGVNGEGRGQIELVGEWGQFALDGEWANPALGELG